MFKILVFSDIHMRKEGGTILGLDPYEQISQALNHGMHNHPDADHIIFLGDISNSGKIEEYQRFKCVLDLCKKPYSLMVGNHDNRDNLLAVLGDVPDTSDGFLQKSIDLGANRLLLLDTLNGPPFRNDMLAGFMDKTRLDWVQHQIDAVPNKRVIVFAHHPISDIGMDGLDEIRLKNADTLLEILKTHKNVAHVFGGHVHRTVSGTTDGLAFTLFKSTCHQTPLILGHGPDSMAVTEPAGYGIVLLQKDSVIAHTEDFQTTSQPKNT